MDVLVFVVIKDLSKKTKYEFYELTVAMLDEDDDGGEILKILGSEEPPDP